MDQSELKSEVVELKAKLEKHGGSLGEMQRYGGLNDCDFTTELVETTEAYITALEDYIKELEQA